VVSATWHATLLLVSPRRIDAQRARLAAVGLPTPTLWQLELGVLRMWHRTLFRSETIGLCAAQPVRDSWRARLLRWRPLRFPFLLAESAVAPWDMTGLYSSSERLIRHLLGAHHDATQFVYDLQILALTEGALDDLRARAAAVVTGVDPRADWLRDLVVYTGYHEALLAGIDRIRGGETELRAADASDPDLSFHAYLRWCAAQPPTPAASWQAWRAEAHHAR
jgi:hypothetical protein